MILEKALLKLARSNLHDEIKKLCAIEFYNEDINEIIDLLQKKVPEKLPTDEEIGTEIKAILKENCDILTINDNEYPKLLREINIAPVVLVVKGDKNVLLNNNIAVVGSRKTDIEDFGIIREIVKNINDLGFGVASGIARGSDIIAHIQSIKTGTIAVLPCGLKYCYPAEHKSILDKIIDFNGIVISGFSFFEKPKQYNFVKRNSLIVGLSDSVVLMRARNVKCGSMISANFAQKFNRSVYTLIFNNECDGNKYLLNRNLATEITSFTQLRYSILSDVAMNEVELSESKDLQMTNLSQSKNNLFANEQSFLKQNTQNYIYNEVRNIIFNKCGKIKKQESSFMFFYKMCCNDIKPNDKEKKEIIKALLENLL